MSWLLAFVGFALLIVLHEAGHFLAAKAVGMRVERFALFFPPMLFTVRRGETEYGVGAIPLGGYVRISGMNPHEELPPEVAHRAYYKQPPWKRIVVILAGPAVNLVLAFLIFWVLIATQDQGRSSNAITAVSAGSPAAAAQLMTGDRLVAVDGVRGDVDALRERINSHGCADFDRDGCAAGDPAQVTVQRDGAERTIAITPRYNPTTQRMLVGVTFGDVTRVPPPGVVRAAGDSLEQMWTVTTGTVSIIGRLFTSERARSEVSGVVGSYETTRQTFVQADYVQAISILGLISLSLAVINLFPFLPLDGGHVFWAVAEKVRRKPIPFSVLERFSLVGFALVAVLFLIGLSNDVDRLAGPGFGAQ